ncbi:hypothetical protein U5801_22600 [Lamprobacter modestohalophilus]|uniref:hypothetical protein n=1 Tax=Lamprobacter modestohalophilus TaxID=1064514 RepID=UPI002ADEC77D|nr:hypothetical protein [Lamprobacter modestohalophilus]MEA1052575.1 hypothetical protein [Lamprobacter modestohalophilus]
MDSSSIRLPGSQLAEISFVDGTLKVAFARAYIIKTMTGSTEKTLWWQAGELVLEHAELLAPLPEPQPGEGLVCDGGDIDENVYTYRDMIPIPLESRGLCRCDLKLRGTDARITAQGETVRLLMQATPKYIEHIRES